jgi:hypothetical protein
MIKEVKKKKKFPTYVELVDISYGDEITPLSQLYF